MSLRIYTGLPASGKTSTIINEMNDRRERGDTVILVLSSEHEELTRRPNVKPGGYMGCRDPSLSFMIDHVIDSTGAAALLEDQSPGTLVVFDEAQFFQPSIVDAWRTASARGVDVLVGTPSGQQLKALKRINHELIRLTVTCASCKRESTQVVYNDDLVYPTHFCDVCCEEHMSSETERLLEIVKTSEPFPGELHTYQPFHGVDMSGWQLVRNDCPARLAIINDAANRSAAVVNKLNAAVEQPTFIDLGCCSGFFADGMASKGFLSAGVDVSRDFIDWASKLAHIKGQAINYQQQDLLSFLTETDRHYDIISTFATVQWVMAQQGYDAGVKCFDEIFARAGSVCVIEMGYTTEEIYRDKIADRPAEINREWVLNLMEASDQFATIELHTAGENGIWRDIFVGFKESPTTSRVFDDLPIKRARQSSNVEGYWEDNWVGAHFSVSLNAESRYKSFKLEGWRPEGSSTSTLKISISGAVIATAEIGEGIFNVDAPVSIDSGSFFELTMSSSDWFSPDDDARQLAFVLRNLEFR